MVVSRECHGPTMDPVRAMCYSVARPLPKIAQPIQLWCSRAIISVLSRYIMNDQSTPIDKRAKWLAANRERARAQQKAWALANPDKMRARRVKYDANHPNRHARKVSGNWRRYCASLLQSKTTQRGLLTTDQLLVLLEKQSYKCALTDREMTCIRGHGRVPTNLSIDRLNPGEPYTIDNVQLVCSDINSWRGDCSLSDFIDTCCLIAVRLRAYKPPD